MSLEADSNANGCEAGADQQVQVQLRCVLLV